MKTVKIRIGQPVPEGEWDEVVYAINHRDEPTPPMGARIAMPVFTHEGDFNRLRNKVKALLRAGFTKFEAADLATLRMLKALGITDITADWTLYAFNSRTLKLLADLGIKRFVASPENDDANIKELEQSGYAIERLARQATPLFISLTEPEAQTELCVFERDGLFVTTKRQVREWPGGTRFDYSWDPPEK